jgi:hypothetical protein
MWLLIVLIAASTPATLDGRQCVVFDDPALLFEQSEVVFVGIAVALEPTGIKGNHVVSHRGTFRVERIWKGEPQRVLTIGADAPFTIGSRYVVFAGGKPLSTTLLCKWSELESEAEEKREWLRKKQSRRPH